MQAHTQSTSAARTSLPPLQVPALASRLASHPVQTGVRHLLPVTPLPIASTLEGIAQGSGLAHDAGNLLGALKLYCDLLRAPGVLRHEHRHYATELSLISNRSSALIQRLLGAHQNLPGPAPIEALEFQPSAVRRRESEQFEPARPDLAHSSVLRNLAPVLDRIAAGAAKVQVVLPASLPRLELPVETLERVTVNLVRNAAEAIRTQQVESQSSPALNPGEIRVAFGPVAGRLQLTVEDNGPGVPPAIAAAFLQPAKLPPDTRRGLGHRIVHELVASSGGQISIRVRPGRGTTFCIKWPLPNASVDSASGGPSSSESSPFSRPPAASLARTRGGVATC